jgi:hypothetical protein
VSPSTVCYHSSIVSFGVFSFCGLEALEDKSRCFESEQQLDPCVICNETVHCTHFKLCPLQTRHHADSSVCPAY